MKKLFRHMRKWFRRTFKIKTPVKEAYVIVLKTGDQRMNFEATTKEFKSLFSTIKGIRVFKANNIIVPISSIAYWYKPTEEELNKAPTPQVPDNIVEMIKKGEMPCSIPGMPDVTSMEIVPDENAAQPADEPSTEAVAEVKKDQPVKKRGRPSKKKVAPKTTVNKEEKKN